MHIWKAPQSERICLERQWTWLWLLSYLFFISFYFSFLLKWGQQTVTSTQEVSINILCTEPIYSINKQWCHSITQLLRFFYYARFLRLIPNPCGLSVWRFLSVIVNCQSEILTSMWTQPFPLSIFSRHCDCNTYQKAPKSPDFYFIVVKKAIFLMQKCRSY